MVVQWYGVGLSREVASSISSKVVMTLCKLFMSICLLTRTVFISTLLVKTFYPLSFSGNISPNSENFTKKILCAYYILTSMQNC